MLHDTSPLHFLTQPRQLLSNVKDLNANPLLLSSTCHTPALLLATLSHNHTQLVAFAETTGRSVGREVKQKRECDEIPMSRHPTETEVP